MQDKSQKSLLEACDAQYSLLQYCCEHNFIDAVKLLLESGANVNFSPNRVLSRRPVMIACARGRHKILKVLLQMDQLDLSQDENGENPLHVVVKSAGTSKEHQECLKILLGAVKENRSRLNINAQDIKRNTPLHYAAKYGGSESVIELLKSGAYIGNENILKDTPLAFMKSSTLELFLDSSVTDEGILQNDNYSIKLNYNFLVPSLIKERDICEVRILMPEGGGGGEEEEEESAPTANRSVPECGPLLYMSRSPDLKHLLTHPVFTSFIQLKWQRIRKFYYINLLFYFLFVLLLTIYILFGYRQFGELETTIGTNSLTEPPHSIGDVKIAHDKDIGILPAEEGNPNISAPVLVNTGLFIGKKVVDSHAVYLVRIILIGFLILLGLRETFQVFIHPKKYLTDPENLLEIALIIIASVVVIKDCSREFQGAASMSMLCPQFCAIAILFSWFELVLLIGKHPLQSLHIEMFKTVSINFLKFLAWYAILIFAFALSFYTLFRNCDETSCGGNPFTNPGVSIFKTIVMLTGEFEAGDIPFISFMGTSHLIFIGFVFLIAIVLLNLLNGLAVADTQTIRDDAILYSTISLVRVISYIENMLLGDTTLIQLPFNKLWKLCSLRRSRKGENKNETPCCFKYFAERISFFPTLLKDEAIYCYPNKHYKIAFNSQETKNSDPDSNDKVLCSKLSQYYLDYSTAKKAEKILADREANAISEPEDKAIDCCNSKISELEKKLENLEYSAKQNEKLLIQILAILSLNNANNQE